MNGWTPQAIEKASKPVLAGSVARTQPPKGKTQPGPPASIAGEEITPPVKKSQQHYVGPYQLAVANGTHYPGRSRIVIVGPASEALTAALVEALQQFVKS